MDKEIERKFLLLRYPDSELQSQKYVIVSRKEIDQTYLAHTKEEQIRVRKLVETKNNIVEERYTLTFKRGIGLVREEVEFPISRDIYHQLLGNSDNRPLKKERITISDGATQFEIDLYDQFDLKVVEVEFKDEDTMDRFQIPDWFGDEISGDKKLTNKSLWNRVQKEA